MYYGSTARHRMFGSVGLCTNLKGYKCTADLLLDIEDNRWFYRDPKQLQYRILLASESNLCVQ